MPKRTNLFQEVVEIIHSHMAGDSPVEASAMLRNDRTGYEREVDVVIRSNTAGYEIIVSVEAVGRGRRATVEWVEQMTSKHKDLPTSKLVLVSETGFSEQARASAKAEGAVVLSPEELAGDDPAYGVVNAIPSLWPKVVALTPDKTKVWVDQPGTGVGWFWAPPDLDIFLDNGVEMDALAPTIERLLGANWVRTTEQIGLAEIPESIERFFHLQVGPGWVAKKEGIEHRLCLRWDEGPDAPQFHPIEKLEVFGKAVITVTEVPLSHHRLGEVMYAYGEGEMGEQEALFVATEDAEGGQLTIRVRDGDDHTGPMPLEPPP